LLAQSVVAESGGKARFVSENWGDSELARRFGVTRYPAIFVGDVLVATPSDFGFYGPGEKGEGGRYSPLRSAAAHDRFRADLKRMIDLLASGQADAARAASAHVESKEVAALPDVALVDLDGKPISRESLKGRAVLVDFWATWCPPCRGALPWLGELKAKFGDRLAVVAIAIESTPENVRKVVADAKAPLAWVQGSPEIARAFGDVSAVPTLLLFDRDGKAAGSFFGAPPTLHADVESKIAALVK
jgi:thiol-disulfide isomerase/thioredoxin